MHHPICFGSSGCSSSVENEGFLESNAFDSFRGVDWPVCSCSFPESCNCDPIRPRAVLVLLIPWAVEVPFLFSGGGRETFSEHEGQEKSELACKNLREEMKVKSLCIHVSFMYLLVNTAKEILKQIDTRKLFPHDIVD